MSDLKELVSQLSDAQIIDLMTSLGVEQYQIRQDYIVFPTICHNEDANSASMKLYYYTKTKTFHCYTSCGCTFDIIGLLQRRYELLNVQYDFFKDIVLRIGGSARKETSRFYQPYESIYKRTDFGADVNIEPINKGVLNAFTFYPTEEWLNDGISSETMKRYNILYSIIENKIIIPHYNVKGDLIGIRGRALNEKDLLFGKYLPLKIEGVQYSHPLGFNLYGVNFVRENLRKFKVAIVAESEKSCMQYETMFGSQNNIVVAACGNNFNRYQLNILLDCGVEKVIIAFDKEGKTWKEKDKYFKKLERLCMKFKNYCTTGFIYDHKNLLELKQSPFDCGEEVFRQLLKDTIWI